VLLHDHPAVAAVLQRSDELIEHVGMVGQSHLGGRESLYAAQGLQAEQGREEICQART
jgi:hypothetical protein